jgi:DNA-binding transcriptional LysR family regulator
MRNFTLHELHCFDAVAREGSFQAAADKLHRTHPTVFAAVRKLEHQLGLKLLDRSGYRIALTDVGRSFHRIAQGPLRALEGLHTHAAQLAMGQESELRIVVGDLCPLPATLGLLRQFFDACPGTRLHLHFDAISGPWERLFDGDADLILHHIDSSDPRLDFIKLFDVQLIPVVAPGFLPFRITRSITPEQMRDSCQCIIRDTARHSPPRNYFVLEGTQQWTVADQLMKKEVILQGMGWGHMPSFLISQELRDERLLSICGQHFPGGISTIVAARRRDLPHGPTAKRLWQFIGEQAPAVSRSMRFEQPTSAKRQRTATPVNHRRRETN